MADIQKLIELTRPVGKLGLHVYYFVGKEFRKRAYVKPIQPGTPAQTANWSKFASGVSNWQALTPAQKEVWNISAKPEKMSGFNLYMRVHLKS